jgi:hypothetical protein
VYVESCDVQRTAVRVLGDTNSSVFSSPHQFCPSVVPRQVRSVDAILLLKHSPITQHQSNVPCVCIPARQPPLGLAARELLFQSACRGSIGRRRGVMLACRP